ncbi:hypothetical protein SAMN02745121_04119 [Nannocystis exedens]|uniref:Uncharacterized protein n=1 Tax=Nannocystis exedens TaxID=54 RepID=A0A1I2AAT5_9BACT|nr:hypothetical protein NAEX_02719 [Nannocystis exedens]SFE40073.1 hypothetical protein SAMN02745121_04119 [Nannocystis exedens]
MLQVAGEHQAESCRRLTRGGVARGGRIENHRGVAERVLIIEDDRELGRQIVMHLRRAGDDPTWWTEGRTSAPEGAARRRAGAVRRGRPPPRGRGGAVRLRAGRARRRGARVAAAGRRRCHIARAGGRQRRLQRDPSQPCGRARGGAARRSRRRQVPLAGGRRRPGCARGRAGAAGRTRVSQRRRAGGRRTDRGSGCTSRPASPRCTGSSWCSTVRRAAGCRSISSALAYAQRLLIPRSRRTCELDPGVCAVALVDRCAGPSRVAKLAAMAASWARLRRRSAPLCPRAGFSTTPCRLWRAA